MVSADGTGGVLACVDYTAPTRQSGPGADEVIGTASVGFDPPCATCAKTTAVALPLLPGERNITLQVFSDRLVVEAYWLDGRVAITSGGPNDDGSWGSAGAGPSGAMSVEATVGVTVMEVAAWEMGSCWATETELLQYLRLHEIKIMSFIAKFILIFD